MEQQMQGYWNRLKASWYRRGLDYSSFPEAAAPFILDKAAGAKTFLDVGAGCGTLSIPLARAGKRVTALDAAPAMIDILKEDLAKEKLQRLVTPVAAPWGGVRLRPHDALICANVPGLLKGDGGFLKDAPRYAKKFVFFIESADPAADKFYYKELYPILFGKPFAERPDYLETYTALHSMGVFANVEIIEYDFDQPFDDINEAVIFWKEYLGIVTGEHDGKLMDYLSRKLVKKGKVLLARFHKKSAIIWWKTTSARTTKTR